MAHSGALLSSAANTPARTCSPVGSRARAGRLSALPNWPFGSQQQDKLCKDMVNERKDLTGVEGSAKVTFLGAKGQEFTVDNPLDTYMLDAGIAAGLELPYSCRGGICGACVGRVVSGEYDQSDISDLEFTMTPNEIANGMVLTCMCRPVTDCVVETQSDYGYSLGDDNVWPGATGNIFGGKVEPLMGKKWDEIRAQQNV